MILSLVFLCVTAVVLGSLLFPLTQGPSKNFFFVVLAFLTLTTGGFAIYQSLGRPDLPGAPYAARKQDLDFKLAARAEELARQLESNPNPQGYHQLAEMNIQLHRYDRAIEIYQMLHESAKAKAIITQQAK